MKPKDHIVNLILWFILLIVLLLASFGVITLKREVDILLYAPVIMGIISCIANLVYIYRKKNNLDKDDKR